MNNIFYYQTQIGKIAIAESNGQITNLYFEVDTIPENNHTIKETETLKGANEQFQEYLRGQRKTFSLPLTLSGTAFMKSVWNSVIAIPYGKTASYKEIAWLSQLANL